METFPESIRTPSFMQSNAKGRYPPIGFLLGRKGKQSSEWRLLLLALDVEPSNRILPFR